MAADQWSDGDPDILVVRRSPGWCAATPYARPLTATVARSFSRTTAPARTARSYCNRTRRIPHSLGSRSEGRGAAGVPGSAG
ncbi:hypothetical protein ACIQZB_32555 [Streptomyces sp. NPDC097727]|uniref:hypothetical protein n=1 Tax=Streptomyces sp. NPDC097727 TaxID=3366092 RepID=UPI00380F39ED